MVVSGLKQEARPVQSAVWEKVQQAAKGVLGQILWAAGGFLGARTAVFGTYAPFGLAVIGGVPAAYTLGAAVGALLGYFIPVTGGNAFRYITAVLAAASIKWLLHGILKFTRTPLYSALVALAATAVTGAAGAVGKSFSQAVIMIGAESLLAGAGAYFIHRACALRDKPSPGLYSQELAAAVIAVSIGLMALVPFQIGDISIGRVLAVLLVLAAGRFGREAAGAIAGVSAGLAVSLCGEIGGADTLYMAGMYAAGGLLCGVFSHLGKLAAAFAFLLVSGLSAVLAGGSVQSLAAVAETVIAAAAFLALPRKLGSRLADLFSPPAELPRLDSLRKSLTMRLDFASEALHNVSRTVEEVAGRLRRKGAPDFTDVLSGVEEDACKGCALRLHCWETARADTLTALVDMTKAVKRGEAAPEESVTGEWSERCLRPAAVGAALAAHFKDFAARQAAENRIDEVRQVVSDQFEGVSDMLADLAEEFETSQQYDVELAGKIADVLRAEGILTADCGCCIDRFGRMTVELRIRDTGLAQVNRAKLMQLVEAACGRTFDPPCVNKGRQEYHAVFSEKAALDIELGACQYACGDARLCGDAFDTFRDGRGRYFMVLSDGMGTGGRAAVDGAMAAGLMSRLLKAGFGFDCSLRIVNAAMLFKSTDESLATLDVACIDLFTGRTELCKAGAAPTLVRRSGRTGRASCSSLPAGILRDVSFDRASIELAPGDLLVLLSDGAVSGGTDWICAQLEQFEDGDVRELAESIASAARRRRDDGHEDDITVLTALVRKAV